MKRNKTITELKKIFKEKDLSSCKDIPEVEQKGYFDAANVMMVIPKTNIGLEILTSNFELGEPQKVPELTYSTDKGLAPICKYSIEYMNIILEFIKCFGDDESSVIFKVAHEFPLTVELKHFKIILAPRVSND